MWRRYRCLTDSSACWLCHLNSVKERDQRPFSTSNCSAATSQTVRSVWEAFTVLQSCVIRFHWTDFSGFLHQGVVSGILLVTSNKIFFDPCKTHPLVKEHGCEEYLLSCSVDNLTSVSFFSDISHVHFNTSQQRSAMLHSSQTATRADSHSRFVLCLRKKGKKILQQLKRQAYGLLKQNGDSTPALESVHSELSGLALSQTKEVSGEEEEAESRDMDEAERELGGIHAEGSLGILNSTATFCSGGPGTASTRHTVETKPSETAGKDVNQLVIIVYHLFFISPWQLLVVCSLTAPRRSSAGSPGGLMFVRLRVQLPAGKKGGAGALQIGSAKTSRKRDAWLALSQERWDN